MPRQNGSNNHAAKQKKRDAAVDAMMESEKITVDYLVGKMIKMKDNSRGFLAAKIPTEVSGLYQYVGLRFEAGGFTHPMMWVEYGKYVSYRKPHPMDIIGAWHVPELETDVSWDCFNQTISPIKSAVRKRNCLSK